MSITLVEGLFLERRRLSLVMHGAVTTLMVIPVQLFKYQP